MNESMKSFHNWMENHKILHQFDHEEDGMRSEVYPMDDGRIGVRLLDVDSGNVVNIRIYPPEMIDKAIKIAKQWVGHDE